MVKIRLARVGKKNRPSYRIVAADQRFQAKGRFIEILGFYDPINKLCTFDKDTIEAWKKKGAKLSDRVASIVENDGKFVEKKAKPNRKSVKRAEAAEETKKAEAEAKEAEKEAKKQKAQAKAEESAEESKDKPEEAAKKEEK